MALRALGAEREKAFSTPKKKKTQNKPINCSELPKKASILGSLGLDGAGREMDGERDKVCPKCECTGQGG